MKVYGQWPNVERLLIAWLSAACSVSVYTETPSNLDEKVPCLSVDRIPGGNGSDFEKIFTVDVTAWGADRALMWELVQSAETAMVRLNSNGTNGFIDEVTELNSFGNVSYEDLNVRRAVGTYQLTARPQ